MQIAALLKEFGRASERVIAECLKWCAEAPLESLAELSNVGGEDIIAHVLSSHPGMAADGKSVLALFPPSGLSSASDSVLLAILARLPRAVHPIISAVCKRWRVLVREAQSQAIRAAACDFWG